MARTFRKILDNVCLIANESKTTTFLDESSPYSEIKKFIQDVLEEVCASYPWTFREATAYTFNCVAGTSSYSLPVYLEPANILQEGVRIEDEDCPLPFIEHYRLDRDISSESGKPDRYSIYGGNIIFDPTPDDTYEISIKYLKSYFAFSSTGAELANLESENDYTIIPDRFIKTVEYGAAALFRQHFFSVDDKYVTLQKQYEKYLRDMKKADGWGRDADPQIVVGSSPKVNINQVGYSANNYIPDKRVLY